VRLDREDEVVRVELQLDLCGTLDSLYIEDLPWRQQRQLGWRGNGIIDFTNGTKCESSTLCSVCIKKGW
jgi:hypothetical protein